MELKLDFVWLFLDVTRVGAGVNGVGGVGEQEESRSRGELRRWTTEARGHFLGGGRLEGVEQSFNYHLAAAASSAPFP